MKKILFIALLLSTFFGYAQYTLIPDANFEKALIFSGIDSGVIDGKVLTANVSGVTMLNVANSQITDLSGIQDFISLKEFVCGKNAITNLDLSKNIALELLICDNSQLTSIDISNNISLRAFDCSNNQLTSLDLSKTTDLRQLICSNNQLTSLDFSINIVLSDLVCNNNQLTNIDVSKNHILWRIECNDNQLTSLDVSQCTARLVLLACSNNQLTTLNIKNGRSNFSAFSAINNPSLKCIQVDKVTYFNANWANGKDTWVSYSEDCNKTASITPPKITATGNQIYCSGTTQKIVQSVNISFDPAEPSTTSVEIQIASGYATGDVLTLANATLHPTIKAVWIASEGKLKLQTSSGGLVPYADFEAAIKDVAFSNSSANPTGTRTFSINLGNGQLSYLPRNKHYYEYVAFNGITWTSAKTAAETRTYYGLKGYLATLTAADEAQLAGTQAPGAGWIGGSDAQTEGVWKWVTGPEAGTVFWNGVANGSTPNFAFWNTGEPNQFNGSEEDYAHVTAPGVGISGSWNDLPVNSNTSGDYQAKGYIVEYGGMIPGDVDNLNLSASTMITMAKMVSASPNSRCGTGTVNLSAVTIGGTARWYDTAVGGNLLGTGTSFTTPAIATDTPYYVDAGCDTARIEVIATVNPLPLAPAVSDVFYYLNETVLALNTTPSAGCTLNWYSVATGGTASAIAPTPSTATLGTISYFVSQTLTATGCEGPLSEIKVTVSSLPLPPLVSDISYCQNETALALTAITSPNCTLNWYTISIGGTPSFVNPTPSTANTGTTTYYVSQTTPNFLESLLSEIKVTINPLPVVNDVTIVQCDSDLIPNGKTFFNLTVNNNLISANYTNETFSYYTSQNGANTGLSTDLISNQLVFENTTPSIQDVWARVTNKSTDCSSIAKITLKVPATNILSSYKIAVPAVCDDFLDTNGNNTANNTNKDGITTFDFSWTKATLLTQLPLNQVYNINYYRNQADALAEVNVINDISNYRNIGYPNSQDIWVRIESNLDNACLGLGPYITLNVEALPFANPVINQTQCDGDQDGIFTFDTATLETTLLKGQKNVSVTYFDANNNPLKDENGNLIISPFPAPFTTKSQTIKAVVTNNTSQKCFDETTIQFTVVVIFPKAFAVAPALLTSCDDEQDPLNQDGKIAFDTSTFEATILGGQVGMNVSYFDKNGNPLSSPLPNPFVTGTQDVTVIVENPINTSCTATVILPFKVNPLPKINQNADGSEKEVICSNLSSLFVTLNAGIQDGSSTSNYTYVWSKDGNLLADTTPTLKVSTEGTFVVKVTNGFGCSSIRTLKVSASDLAHIDSIDIVDLTDVNTVTVNVKGKGIYEYSLDEPSGFWQDSNFFDNVPAGIHVVYINDKYGCGSIHEPIAVIGAPKFFTPNNDTYNDYWSIKGVNNTFNSKSIVYVFDRYGKLLKQWIPNLSQGWDGTYNGIPLPADDYWFTLKLEDGREAKGHFSLKR